jgi:hypothetical protein
MTASVTIVAGSMIGTYRERSRSYQVGYRTSRIVSFRNALRTPSGNADLLVSDRCRRVTDTSTMISVCRGKRISTSLVSAEPANLADGRRSAREARFDSFAGDRIAP